MASELSVFDRFPWWEPRDVLTQITPDRFDYIRSVAGGLSGRRVLDLGCGGGMLAEPMALEGAVVTAVDVSQHSLEVAQRHALGSGLEIGYVLAPGERMPFREASFQLVVAFDVLEHVSDLGDTIREIARVLAPGGRLIYDTMNRTLLCRVAVIWIGEHLWRGGPPRGTHQWRKLIRPAELRELLARNGIANRETRGFLPVVADRRGGLRMKLCGFKGVSYVGYGVKV